MNKNSDMIATKNFNQPKPNNAHVSIPIPLDRITNTYIGGGLTISQYFKILNDRFDNL